MKSLIILALITLVISDSDIENLSIKVKQNLAKQVKDLPSNLDNLIKNIGGYTNAFKKKMTYSQLQNFFTGQGFPNKVYKKCSESSFEKYTYYDGPDYLLGANNQYSLNYYIAACDKIDGNSLNVVAIKGRYFGTLQQQKVQRRVCEGWGISYRCFDRIENRNMNGFEYNQVRDILKTKYTQDALDKLNRLK